MCDCDYCKLSIRIENEKPGMTEETLNIIRELWARMECAEVDLAWINSKGV